MTFLKDLITGFGMGLIVFVFWCTVIVISWSFISWDLTHFQTIPNEVFSLSFLRKGIFCGLGCGFILAITRKVGA